MLPWNRKLDGFFLGATLIVIIGVLDDILEIDAKTKLCGQIIAGLVAIFCGIQIHYVTNILESSGVTSLGFLSIPLTLFWIVGLTNTMNIIDGLDGLCAGIAFIAAITLAAVQIIQNNFSLTSAIIPSVYILFILAGACLGFLFFNFYPASVFMGDSGSLLLGYCLSILSIMGALKGATLVTLVIPILTLGFPVFDTLFAILRRRWMGKPIFKADREHIHHQLINAGFSHKKVVILLYFVSGFFGLTAILVSNLDARYALGILFILSFTLFLLLMFLRKWYKKYDAK
ncbi:MraY family glycosyltransferase [Candidatus Riflebacteria bacterium]